MRFEETPERLVVRHDARAGFIKFMGWTGVFLLVVTIPTAIGTLVTGGGMPWYQVTIGGLYGVFGVILLVRAPLHLELTVDRAARRIRLVRAFTFGKKAIEYGFADVTAISTAGASGPNMSVVGCYLKTSNGADVPVMLEGGFEPAQAEARALAENLAAAIGVPIEGS